MLCKKICIFHKIADNQWLMVQFFAKGFKAIKWQFFIQKKNPTIKNYMFMYEISLPNCKKVD